MSSLVILHDEPVPVVKWRRPDRRPQSVMTVLPVPPRQPALSQEEQAVADMLTAAALDWLHERHEFDFPDGRSFKPDFFIAPGLYVEVTTAVTNSVLKRKRGQRMRLYRDFGYIVIPIGRHELAAIAAGTYRIQHRIDLALGRNAA